MRENYARACGGWLLDRVDFSPSTWEFWRGIDSLSVTAISHPPPLIVHGGCQVIQSQWTHFESQISVCLIKSNMNTNTKSFSRVAFFRLSSSSMFKLHDGFSVPLSNIPTVSPIGNHQGEIYGICYIVKLLQYWFVKVSFIWQKNVLLVFDKVLHVAEHYLLCRSTPWMYVTYSALFWSPPLSPCFRLHYCKLSPSVIWCWEDILQLNEACLPNLIA